MVRIGHASIDERGKIKGGISGDQSGREVCIRSWYRHSKGWVVLRCKDPARQERIAEAMERACANEMIGYDQNQRDSLYHNVQSSGFDPSRTTKQVETDCSALVRVCIAYAFGADVVGNIRTVSQPETLVKSGHFEKLTNEKYCGSSDYLLRGDILCTPVSGHTAVVLDDGERVKREVIAVEKARHGSANGPRAGSYITRVGLNLRNGAGVSANEFGRDKSVLVKLPAGTLVRCYGYYTNVNGKDWLYVRADYDGRQYTGFMSSKYLNRQASM